MDPALQTLRRQRVIAALVPLFLASGATSLVYETLWERQLHLVVGTSQVAVITVLTAFMTGLAAGGFIASRVADRIKRPVIAYGLLEGAIGLYAVLFPFIIDLITPLYLSFWAATEPSPTVFATFQFVLLGIFLLPPTICMGATLPLLSRFASRTTAEAGAQVGQLYGANTLGAVIGVGLAGFLLLPQLGLQTTTWVTAGGNLALCAVAITLGRGAGELPSDPEAIAASDTAHVPWAVSLSLIAALAGFSSLVYEVSWFRIMGLTLGGSAYAFSIMLLAFLLGIALGGWRGGGAADKAFARGGPSLALKIIAGLQAGIALLSYGAMYLYGELPFAFVALYNAIEPWPEWLWPAKLLLAVCFMMPPALLMGATFPFLVRAAARSTALGGPVGRIYGWNTVGAILGASVGGLLLLPNIQVTGTVLLAASVNLLAVLVALRGAAQAGSGLPTLPIQGGWVIAVAWMVGLIWWKAPPWDPLLMTAGMYKYVSDLNPEDRNRQGVLDFAVAPYDLIFYEEGLSSVVTVARSKKSGNIWLANNGKVDASTNVDMPTQVLVAHLPFVFQPEPENVLVVGLASGITAGSVALHAAPKNIEIVELEAAIVEASHIFDPYNNRPLDDPRVKLIANDGRNHLMLQPEGRYDLIVSEPSNPWLTGVSNLFTLEFFEMGKSRLAPGGVWSQWVQMYGMDHEDLRALLHTFSSVYAHVYLFSTIEDADLVLIGSDSPMDLSADAVAHMMRLDAAVAKDLELIKCGEPEDVLVRYQLDRDGIMGFAGSGGLNTDDNMRIEYSAPLHLHEETADTNFYELLQKGEARQTVPFDAVDGVEGRLALAHAYARRDDYLKALLTLKDAARIDDTSDGRIQLYYDQYQRALTTAIAQAEQGDDDAPSDTDETTEDGDTGGESDEDDTGSEADADADIDADANGPEAPPEDGTPAGADAPANPQSDTDLD